MIARVWHATATPSGAEAYRRHFAESVVPTLQGLDGHRGAYLLQRDHDGNVEIQVFTLWESLEDVERFAGPAFDAAVVEPEAKAVLIAFDTTVVHHTIVLDTVTDSS